MITTFQSRFGDLDLLTHTQLRPSSTGDATPPAVDIADGPVLTPRVNHGRWIVDCPTIGCNGAEYAAPLRDGVPVFFCCECRNRAVGHQPLPVAFPLIRDHVEDMLERRPDPATRNWFPYETVEHLAVENIAQGVA